MVNKKYNNLKWYPNGVHLYLYVYKTNQQAYTKYILSGRRMEREKNDQLKCNYLDLSGKLMRLREKESLKYIFTQTVLLSH